MGQSNPEPDDSEGRPACSLKRNGCEGYRCRVTGSARRIIAGRALRGFADGLVSVLLAGYLSRIGFTAVEIGAVVTATLLGSAGLTIGLGLIAHRIAARRVLLAAAVLMLGTGAAFFTLQGFWPLLVVAALGTLNPSAGDVSVFLPAEQAMLAETTRASQRAAAFARYNVGGNLTGALGALAAGLPAALAAGGIVALVDAERGGFLLYAAVAIAVAALYRQLPRRVHRLPRRGTRPLARSRGLVRDLALLFSLDSFGGGFVVQSLLVLWLSERFALSPALMGTVFFAAGLVGALSQLVSPLLAARIGYVRTMVYTHLPANLFLIAAGLVPDAWLAITLLLLRAALSQMDVPARQALVMAAVPAEARAAAASFTNVPRSLAAAIPPLFTGWLLEHSAVGWPLVVGGTLKVLYDVLLLLQARRVDIEGT